ncbi:hypothetical protein DL89DRAFT_320761 [Linderina pennispora]|uniref:GPI anchored protein n=1 Tax=Linderina pennispora TaxID=61395 RepID=A0A1Y1WHN2_9FUNG|nr:uncharacterized protein DL89DRAFT_320761 [Linderina pennispora]ORX73081.1 hypothetical protein DL89DRAFT_320761 [Linderina pennispora]
MHSKLALTTLVSTVLTFTAAQLVINSGDSASGILSGEGAVSEVVSTIDDNPLSRFSDPSFLASLSAANAAASSMANGQYPGDGTLIPAIGDAIQITASPEDPSSSASSATASPSGSSSAGDDSDDDGITSDVESKPGVKTPAGSSATSTKPNGATGSQCAVSAVAAVAIVAAAFF